MSKLRWKYDVTTEPNKGLYMLRVGHSYEEGRMHVSDATVYRSTGREVAPFWIKIGFAANRKDGKKIAQQHFNESGPEINSPTF